MIGQIIVGTLGLWAGDKIVRRLDAATTRAAPSPPRPALVPRRPAGPPRLTPAQLAQIAIVDAGRASLLPEIGARVRRRLSTCSARPIPSDEGTIAWAVTPLDPTLDRADEVIDRARSRGIVMVSHTAALAIEAPIAIVQARPEDVVRLSVAFAMLPPEAQVEKKPRRARKKAGAKAEATVPNAPPIATPPEPTPAPAPIGVNGVASPPRQSNPSQSETSP